MVWPSIGAVSRAPFVWLGGFVFLGPMLLAWLGRLTLGEAEYGMRAAALVYSWPVVFGVCLALFFLLFRQPLGDFIREVGSVKAGGVELTRVFAPMDAKRRKIDNWLGNPESDERRRLRRWLKDTLEWDKSEAVWVNTAREHELDQAIKALNIDATQNQQT